MKFEENLWELQESYKLKTLGRHFQLDHALIHFSSGLVQNPNSNFLGAALAEILWVPVEMWTSLSDYNNCETNTKNDSYS